MANAMPWRGPDGSGAWAAGPAALGHLALHSTPQSLHDQQPLHDRESGLVIVADARLDHRAELCRQLGLALGDDLPDSKLILAAWQRWGRSCVDRLLGDFAFALWDSRARRLFCARDPLGLRPFYYAHAGDQLVFASSARAVVTVRGVPADLDQGRVADYLEGNEGSSTTRSFFSAVKRLPPAHTAVFEDSSFRLQEYWHPDIDHELILASDGEYLEAFSEVFGKVVSDLAVSQEPPALMLSGGIDSSTIVAVAREQSKIKGRSHPDTFSAISADPDNCIETGFINKVVAQGGIKPRFVSPHVTGPASEAFDRVMGSLEEPWESLHLVATRVYLDAASRGHRVVLDGIDGDQVVSLPWSYPEALARQGRLALAWRESRHQQRKVFRREPTLRNYLGVLRRAAAGRGRGDAASRLRRTSAARIRGPDLVVGIERYERLAAVCGIESRKPYMDRRIVEFCLSLPWDQKTRDGWTKYVLRKLAETMLPHELAWRRGKEHLAPVFAAARLASHRGQWQAALEAQSGRLSPWAGHGRVETAVRSLAEGSTVDIGEVRMLLSLARWLERNGH